jgi:DNA polymerase-1
VTAKNARGPLLVVDAPSLMYRAFFALPDSILGRDGMSVNALLGTANLVLQVVERDAPRAVVLCFGAEAAVYRKALYEPYHGDRPEMPDKLVPQWAAAREFFTAFGWTVLEHDEVEADDLLGSLAAIESGAGGRALLFTGDRDMFQCVGDSVAVLWPGQGASRDGPELIDADGVRERYGIEPGQVPDFIALRGDPSDGLPGAKGIGEKTARDLLRAHGTLEGVIANAAQQTPRIAAALTGQADELRAFLDIATLRSVKVKRPPDAPFDRAAAAAAARDFGMNRLADRLAP